MAEAIFDKEGNITNLTDLTADEINAAAKEQREKILNRAKESEAKEKEASAKALKAEEDLKAEREKAVKPPEKAVADSDPEEIRLIAKGLSDEEIDQIKVIAKGQGVSLSEAAKTPLFKLFQDNLKEEQRKEKAKLGASGGSGNTDAEIEIKPGMPKDDHKEVWKKNKGNLR